MRLKHLFSCIVLYIFICVLLAICMPVARVKAMVLSDNHWYLSHGHREQRARIDSSLPDLMVSITSDLPIAQVGQPITYTIKTSNSADAGPVQDGDPIKIRIALPDGLLNMTVTSGRDWKIVADPRQNEAVAFYTGAYPVSPGQQFNPITINGTLTAFTASLAAEVEIFTPEDDNLDNNAASSPEREIILAPDLEPTLTPLNPPFIVGTPGTFQINVRNNPFAGPVLAGQPIKLTFSLPAGCTSVEAKAGNDWQISVDATTNQIAATYAGRYPIKPDQLLLPITVSFTPEVDGSDTATVTVATPNDSDPENNTATFQVQVLPVSAFPW